LSTVSSLRATKSKEDLCWGSSRKNFDLVGQRNEALSKSDE
jgi:hypothetical protein